MFSALVVTLREGVEAALIVGITLVYLVKIGRPDLRRTVYYALAAALVGSIAGAVALSYAPINQDKVEGWVMLVAAVFVISMVIFMMRTARKLKGEIETKVGSLAGGGGSQWGLFAFVFLMVFREGIETVAILAGVSLNSTELMSFLGTLLGVALAVVFGVMFVKGSVRIDLRKFFKVTTVILFFVAAQLIISGLHELSESGVLPSSKREMALIGPIARNDYFFPVTMLALVVLMVLLEYRRRKPEAVAVPATKAEERKQLWTAQRERLWAILVCVTAFVFITTITAEMIYAEGPPPLSQATEVNFTNGKAVISAKDLPQGELQRYSATINGTKVRFLLYRKPDGKVASVFDACQICGGIGFYKGTNGIICKNCAAPVNPQSVGQPGGCNPIPLQSAQDGDSVVISITDVAQQAGQFSK
ncbi:MAG TPA: Fe-S-containing protein [Candidatus Angelobacter sp.]|nr:Fe-S-containing protein [Candidatus Angelobacter sp.]